MVSTFAAATIVGVPLAVVLATGIGRPILRSFARSSYLSAVDLAIPDMNHSSPMFVVTSSAVGDSDSVVLGVEKQRGKGVREYVAITDQHEAGVAYEVRRRAQGLAIVQLLEGHSWSTDNEEWNAVPAGGARLVGSGGIKFLLRSPGPAEYFRMMEIDSALVGRPQSKGGGESLIKKVERALSSLDA